MKGKRRNSVGDERIDVAAIKANVAELDRNIDFDELATKLPEDQRQQVAEKAGEWLEMDEVEGRRGTTIGLSADVREGLADLAKRALVVQAISSNNALEGVYRNGMVADQITKLLKGCGAERGFLGWCQKHGWSRATMYRDRKLAKAFGKEIEECVGISENKLYACACKRKSIEWVLENKPVLISAKNIEEVKSICSGPQSEQSAATTDDQKAFEPRTNFAASKRNGSWVARIGGLTEAERDEIQAWNDSLPGNQPVSKALDRNEQDEEACRGTERLGASNISSAADHSDVTR